jgi:hypothetical protein
MIGLSLSLITTKWIKLFFFIFLGEEYEQWRIRKIGRERERERERK